MKKNVSFGFFVFFLFGLLTAPAVCQTGDEIAEKMIDAMGGRKVLEGIKDMTVSTSAEMISLGIESTITVYMKEPNLARSDMSVMGMIITQGFNGETAWLISPETGAAEDLSEEVLEYAKRDSLGHTALLHPEKFGITFSYKGKEKIEDKDYLILEQAFDDGFTKTLYLDPETYLPFKIVSKALNTMMMEVEQEIFPAEYKKIQGMVLPHSMIVFQDGEEFMMSTVTEVKINTGLEDSLFKKKPSKNLGPC